MFNGRFGSGGYVGIDIGARSVKMLQLRERGGQLSVVGAYRFDTPAADTSAEQVEARWQHALSTGGFTGRSCVVSLPRHAVGVQAVRLPTMSDAEMRDASRWEASQRFNLDHRELVADYMRTGASLQGKESREEVVLFAASSERVREIIRPLMNVGLCPAAVDVAAAALARVFSRRARREADKDDVRAVLEIGYGGSTVLILRGRDISMCKPIELGGMHLDQAVADHLQVDVAAAADLRRARLSKACEGSTASGESITIDSATDRAVFEAVRPLMGTLGRELTMCLRYYGVTFRGASPRRIMLAGGDCVEPRLRETLMDSCNIEVAYDDEFATLAAMQPGVEAAMRGKAGSIGDWVVASGLSMRAFTTRVSSKRSRRAA